MSFVAAMNKYGVSKVTIFPIIRLTSGDVSYFRAMLDMFGREFQEIDTYSGAQPSDTYINELLASDSFFALVATREETVVGAIAGYELKKFEQERSEFYIYDLAVDEGHRRKGIATALIRAFGNIAEEKRAWVMFVQADPTDQAAVALYEKMGQREDVYHFDIAVS